VATDHGDLSSRSATAAGRHRCRVMVPTRVRPGRRSAPARPPLGGSPTAERPSGHAGGARCHRAKAWSSRPAGFRALPLHARGDRRATGEPVASRGAARRKRFDDWVFPSSTRRRSSARPTTSKCTSIWPFQRSAGGSSSTSIPNTGRSKDTRRTLDGEGRCRRPAGRSRSSPRTTCTTSTHSPASSWRCTFVAATAMRVRREGPARLPYSDGCSYSDGCGAVRSSGPRCGGRTRGRGPP
jgi:hypothetical protein